MVRPIFGGLTIAVVGDLGASAQWTDANIKKWVVDYRKGNFVRDRVDGNVTHVVCSKEVFWEMGPLIKAAIRHKACHIVTLDWLDFSMQKNKLLPVKEYSHRRALFRKRQREKKREREEKGLELAKKEVNTNHYRVYSDYTHFTYEVVLTREVVLPNFPNNEAVPATEKEVPMEGEVLSKDELMPIEVEGSPAEVEKEPAANDEKANIREERYVLKLYQSLSDRPHLYWFVAKFYSKKGDSRPKVLRPSPTPGVFAREFAKFTTFFKQKAGIPWEQRLVKAGTAEKDFFQYQPPMGGKPVGWAPAEYIPAEIPDIRMLDASASTITTAPSDTTTSPATNTNDIEEDIHSKIAALAAKMSEASARNEYLLTPAPSPRADTSITVAH